MEKAYILSKLFIFMNILCITSCAITDCHSNSVDIKSCQCVTNNGFLVDLHKLFDWIPTPVTLPMFNSTDGPYMYSYKPCFAFNLGTACLNVAACQMTVNSATGYPIGSPPLPQVGGNFTGFLSNNTLSISYPGSGGRLTVVNLRCSKVKYKFTAIGETATGSKIYVMTLESSLFCPSEGTGLSIGTIMCIVFFVLLFIYFVAGFALMYFVKGARGTEAIPNYEFWSDLPGLIKDGFMFVARGCKTETDNTYQKI